MNYSPDAAKPAAWGLGQTAAADIRRNEELLERRVSEIIGDMPLLWLDVGDEAGPASDRAYLERNIIGLLSRSYVLSSQVECDWLGNMSDDYRISMSGLWNLDHLFYPPDQRFLGVLKVYVSATLGGRPAPETSLAPKNWHKGQQAFSDTPSQLKLFAESDAEND